MHILLSTAKPNMSTTTFTELPKNLHTRILYKTRDDVSSQERTFTFKRTEKLLFTNLFRGVGNVVSIKRSRSSQVRPKHERLRREPRVWKLVRGARRV